MPDVHTQLHLFKPMKSTKAYFAEKVVPTLGEDKFNNFKKLFEDIMEIISVNNEISCSNRKGWGRRFFCDGDEASGHHACMNGHLPTARQRQDMCAYSGGGGESGGSVGKIWKRLLM